MTVKIKEVYAIPEQKEGDEKRSWTKIGVAFVCKDSSINVVLDAFPTTGKMNIRDYKEKKQQQSGTAS